MVKDMQAVRASLALALTPIERFFETPDALSMNEYLKIVRAAKI